jgi:uncharacterized repeat protein (TIGR04042 family)
MPEMHFRVRWPDDTQSNCYSPSLVIKEYLNVGERYAVDAFVDKTRTALSIASERVRAKYGFACSAAADQMQEIEHAAARFADLPDAFVTVEAFTP